MPILGANSSGGSRPSAPVIGSATDGGTGTTASVAFTPSTYIGKGTITYTATSSPGSITASGSSPITVTGLTTGTAYTFTVQGSTNYGVTSATSSASNSVTPAVPTTFDSIASATATGGETSFTFSSIPSTYSSLHIRVNAKNEETFSYVGQIEVRMNSDTGSNYSFHLIYADGSSVNSTGVASGTSIPCAYAAGDTAVVASMFGSTILDIQDYASTTKYKTTRSFTGFDRNAATGLIRLYSGSWRSTTAINSLQFIPSGSTWKAGTTISLYGIR